MDHQKTRSQGELEAKDNQKTRSQGQPEDQKPRTTRRPEAKNI